MRESVTADPKRARAHARAMAGTRVEAMPIVPASSCTDLPPGVEAGRMLWEETLAPGGYTCRDLARGAHLRLIDLRGDACVSMLVFNTERPAERLNVADTVKVQWNSNLEAGRLLLSDMGRVLLSILADDARTHDAFCGPSTLPSNARKYGGGANWSEQPNARDRLLLGTAKIGLGPRDVHPCINWFKAVHIAADGATLLQVGPFPPGRTLLLRAEMNVTVVVANCPHVLDPRPLYTVTPVRCSAWRGLCAAPEDSIRNSTPESLRAFLNTEEYFRR